MTPSERPPAPDQQPGATFDQRGQAIYGPQTNIGSIHHHPPRPPITPRVLPIIDTTHFTGRKNELERMRALLLDEPRSSMIGIWGGPGVGKSALTRYFAEVYADHFPAGVIGLDARDKSADALAAHFAAIIGEPVDEEYELDPGPIMQTRFAQRRILLILDNVTRPDVRFLAPGSQAALIVTTRDRELLEHLGIGEDAQFAVPYFEPNESRLFLRQLLGAQALAKEAPAVDTLIKLLAGLPLALRIVGATLRSQAVVPARIARFVAKLQDERARLRTLRWRDVDELNLETVFRLSLALLTNAEQQLFACLAACVATDFGLAAAAASAGLTEEAAGEPLSRLVNLALVDYDADLERFRLHALLHLFARSEAERLQILLEAERRHARYFVTYTRQRQTLSGINLYELTREQAAILQTAAWMVTQRNFDPLFWHGLRQLLDARGHWQDAIALIQSYIDLADELGNDLNKAHFYLQLGRYYRHLANFDEAVAVYQHSLTILEGYRDQRGIAMVLNSLGGALERKGQLDEAIQHYQRSLVLEEAIGDQRGIAIVLNSLGGALERKGQLDEAIQHYQRSLTLGEANNDQRHIAMIRKKLIYAQNYTHSLDLLDADEQTDTMTGVDYRRAGKQFMQRGDHEAALKHFLIALNVGIETTQIGRLHSQAGEAAMRLENYLLAAEQFRQAIDAGEATNFTYTNLAWSLYQLQEDKAVIESNFLQALTLDKKNPWTYSWYSTLLKETGRLAEAEQAARKAVALRKDNAIFLNNLALIFEAYGDRGHLLEAERYFLMAIAYAKPDFPYPQEYLQRVRTRLAQNETT